MRCLYDEGEGEDEGRRRGSVLDMAWSLNIRRSYHLIGTCGRGGVLRVHRLKRCVATTMATRDNTTAGGS